MPTRRLVLGALIATPLLAALRGRAAADRRTPAVGEVFAGDLIVATGNPSPHPVKRRGRRVVATPAGDHVVVRRRLRVRRAHLFSVSNQNDRYVAYVELRERIGDAMTWLRAPDGAVVWAGSFGDRNATFSVTRDQAVALAAVWGIDVRDRVPLGTGLVGHWRPRDHRTAVGDPIVIELEVENTSAAQAYFSVGGHQRGPRDNRFSFTATDAAGAAVPAIDAQDFGGVMGYVELVPGKAAHVETQLERYLTLERGGVYDVTCRYNAELVTGFGGAGWPEHGHETWDLELTGRVEVRLE